MFWGNVVRSYPNADGYIYVPGWTDNLNDAKQYTHEEIDSTVEGTWYGTENVHSAELELKLAEILRSSCDINIASLAGSEQLARKLVSQIGPFDAEWL